MPTLHQYDYLFAVGTIFAFLDAWNIGANDVANSWASSVSSRSITYLQAMCGAAVMEFSGALGVGGRVADTIRTKIVDTEAFASEPALLMLGMVCAVIASSCYLTMATKLGFPVSTTHSILGGVLGMGIGALGGDGVTWVGYKDNGDVDITKGVVQVFLAWIIAPFLSGSFAAIIFLFTKYSVLLRKNPARTALMYIPFYFWLTASLIVMLLIWKGGDYEVNLTGAEVPGVIVAAGFIWGLLMAIFLVPWVYRVVIREDWRMRPYHILMGPLLWRKDEVPPPPADFSGLVRNFYEGHLTKDELKEQREHTSTNVTGANDSDDQITREASEDAVIHSHSSSYKSIIGPRPPAEAKWWSPQVVYWRLKWAIFRGVDRDVVVAQKSKSSLSANMDDILARAQHFDNRAEFLYTFLQVMTAATASLVHGANDVANAIGPYASIYQIWNTGEIPGDKAKVPLWILAFGGAAIAIGLWTYGYHIMGNLGNKVTLMSPARGFCMELGSVITIIIATRLKLPVSTTQCITGAIVGVGLCNGDWRTINWKMVAWIYLGWIITVPTAGLIAGLLMGFVTYAPHW